MDIMILRLSKLLVLVREIPATFWGVVFGSFFTLIGIKLTNRANNQRLQAQLSHEWELQKKERELSLRREVYLTAVEAMSAGIVAFNCYSDVSIPSNNLTEMYYEKAPSIGKVKIIAGEETVKALGHFMRELNTACAQLMTKRLPLELLNHQLTILAQRIAWFEKEREHTLELIKQRNLDGVEEPKLWERMEKASKFEQNISEELRNKRSILVADSFAKGLAYSAECISEVARLNQLLVPVLVAMREELELPINTSVFEQDSRKMQEHARESAERLQQFITAQFGEGGKQN